MIIPNKLLKKWQVLRSEADTNKIAESANVTGQSIRNAFSTGKTSDEIFKAMADYYEQKEEKIRQYL